MLIILISLCLVQANSASGCKLPENQLRVNTLLGQPVMLVGKKQLAYLQVGLTGLETPCRYKHTPVNIAIVIDKSGSMQGEKIAEAKRAAIMAIERLNPDDIISVVTYDASVNVLVPATKVSDKDMIFSRIRAIRAGGSTALYDGVCKGACEMRKFLTCNRIKRLILLSDGLANVGPDSPKALGQLGASLIKEGISVTTIGLGLGYNEDLMTQLAYKSDGNHYFAENACQLASVFDSEFGNALSVIAQEIRININCAYGIRPVRLLGREGNINGQNAEVFINQLHGQNEKFVMLEVEIPASAKNIISKHVATVDVSYSNLITHKTDKLRRNVRVSFSDSKALVEQHTNCNVMANVVELIATERNEIALELRDEGKIEEAKDMLVQNSDYLTKNATRYQSTRLGVCAEQQISDSANMDEENWTRQRKVMRSEQFKSKRQQK